MRNLRDSLIVTIFCIFLSFCKGRVEVTERKDNPVDEKINFSSDEVQKEKAIFEDEFEKIKNAQKKNSQK